MTRPIINLDRTPSTDSNLVELFWDAPGLFWDATGLFWNDDFENTTPIIQLDEFQVTIQIQP